MTAITITIDVEITEEDFEDIQFGMGTGYWADDLFRRNDGELHGFEFRVWETDDNDKDYLRSHEVTLDEMREAFADIVSNGDKYDVPRYIQEYFIKAIWDGEDGGIDCGHIDTEAADVWAQIAIWGYIVYS